VQHNQVTKQETKQTQQRSVAGATSFTSVAKETTERIRGIQRLEAKFAQTENGLDADDQRNLLTGH
jgi:hypothetical protein